MQYALIKANKVHNVIVLAEGDNAALLASLAQDWDHVELIPPEHAGAGVGWSWDVVNGFVPPTATAPVEAEPVWEWLIDVGPFFDRFGAAKMAVLANSDPVVRALVTDLQVRKWIDLKRPDVAQGIDILITKVPGVTPSLKDAVLNTPVAEHENLALRKLYFS